MRVYIKTKNKRRFCIPVPMPMFLIRIALSGYVKNLILKHVDVNARKYIENIDFKALCNGLEDIKSYKGLKMVDVADKEGNEITVIV